MAMSNPPLRYAVLKFWDDGVPTLTFQSDPEQIASSGAGEIGKVIFSELTARFDCTAAGSVAKSDYSDESLRLVYTGDQAAARDERVRSAAKKIAQEEGVLMLTEKIMNQAIEAFRNGDDEDAKGMRDLSRQIKTWWSL